MNVAVTSVAPSSNGGSFGSTRTRAGHRRRGVTSMRGTDGNERPFRPEGLKKRVPLECVDFGGWRRFMGAGICRGHVTGRNLCPGTAYIMKRPHGRRFHV